MSRFITAALLGCLALVSGVQAAQTGDTLNINFRGTFMLTTSCTVNNDQPLNITFGNVGVNKVDGVAYSQPIPYTVDCKGGSDDTALTLSVSGTAVSFDEAAVVSSTDGLGIQIQSNGQPLKLNQPIETTLGAISDLKLTAVPVKDPQKSLAAEVFTATATLSVNYQ